MNSVQGLDHLWSITSRGTVEVDLFFSWNVDMYHTLELVNAALARVQTSLPPTAKLTANRLTFAAFPIMGYSLTSDTVPQTRLWEMATYEIKPRLNRMNGVSMVVVQGGQVPEFEVQARSREAGPDPIDRSQYSGCHRPQQPDRFARPDRNAAPTRAQPGQRPGASTPDEISNIVVKTTPAGAPVRIGDLGSVAALRHAGLYHRHRRWEARRVDEYLSASRTATPCRWRMPCTPRSQSIQQDAAPRRQSAAVLRSIGNRERLHQ